MTGRGNGRSEGEADCQCKIGRSARTYGLADLDSELRRRHQAGASLRELEQFVNESLLERAIRDADIAVVGSVGSVLETLAGDDASAGERAEVRGRLASGGLDADGLESDFVSYQTVRTHLRKCLGIDTGHQGEFTLDDAQGTIEWSRSRNLAVIERTLDRLRNGGALQTGSIEVSDVVRVTCTACGASYPVDGLLADGRCDCDAPD